MEILFPPIVDTYQKAFVFGRVVGDKTENSATLKFTNPNGSNASVLEISVTDRNNRSVLLAERQAEGDETLSLVEYKITDENVNFAPGNWYKVQGRYIKTDLNNKKTYSEWSTVSLIKAINQPEIQLTLPSTGSVTSSSINVSGIVDINDTDTVKSYQIILEQGQGQDKTVVEKTGVLYPIATNQIGPYQLKHSLFDGKQYTLTLEYETNGFYKGEKKVTFKCELIQKELGGLFQVKPINEKGYVEIQLGLTESDITNKIYNIQRSSYKDNHSKRETLFTVNLDKFDDYPNALNDSACKYSQVFADTTAEPGIIYRYYLADGNGNEYTNFWDKVNLLKEGINIDEDNTSYITINNGNEAPYNSDSDQYEYKYVYEKENKASDISIKFNNSMFDVNCKKVVGYNEFFVPNIYLYNALKTDLIDGQKYILVSTHEDIELYIQGKNAKGKQSFLLNDEENKEKVKVIKKNDLYYWKITFKNKWKEGSYDWEYTQLVYCGLNIGTKDEALTYSSLQAALFLDVWDENEVPEEPFKKSTLPFRETMLDTEHIHLTDKNSSFVLNLNPSITNYKYVVQESITNTLGFAFPFVRRSGNTKYRQFNIGGTICGYGDQDGMLLTSNSVYSLLGQSFFDQYKLANRIMPWNDYIFEKQYRDKAIEFLMDGKPKIFKSFTEGNMIVALTAISFTPNKQLANNIYDFTATVTEIAGFTIENCKKYNCYEDKAEKIWSPAEYYLIANEMDGNTAGVSGSMIEDNYLTVYEISNALKPYVFTDELAEILANDSVNRGTNT